MKIVCSQSDLKSNLALANRAIPSRPEPPVLSNILLIADEKAQKVSITAFDGSLSVKTSFNAEVIEGGEITLPAKLLNEIVSKLPEVEITLEIPEDEDNFLATLSSASGKFQLTGIDATEFPELPALEASEILELPIALLTEGLSGCLFAASAELSKQVLTGVHIKTQTNSDNTLEFAATDSHRLAVVEASLVSEEEAAESLKLPDFAITIPAKALRELEKIVSDAEPTAKVTASFDDSQMTFKLGERILTSARIPGDYPAYGQLIPQSFAREAVVERKRLLSSLELVAVMAQKNSIVKFTIDSDNEELIVSADAQDVGNAKQTLPAQIIGDSIDIAFNIKYLMDGLKAIPATEIKMQLNDWNQPVIFTPLGGLKMTYLVMPVQIRN